MTIFMSRKFILLGEGLEGKTRQNSQETGFYQLLMGTAFLSVVMVIQLFKHTRNH